MQCYFSLCLQSLQLYFRPRRFLSVFSFMAIANLFCLMLGGMETLETSKPDLVFDGELDFEKGVMFTMHVYFYSCS